MTYIYNIKVDIVIGSSTSFKVINGIKGGILDMLIFLSRFGVLTLYVSCEWQTIALGGIGW